MKKIIKLPSRYGGNYIEIFDRSEDDSELQYELKCKIPYIRVIYEEKKAKINAVDPDGGPFMAIGDKSIVKGYSISKINDTKNGIIITFKKDVDS